MLIYFYIMDHKTVTIKLQTMKRNFFRHLTTLHSAFNIKKMLLTAAVATLWLSQATAAPGEELLNLFNRTFPDAKYTRWTEDKEHYIVSFSRNESLCRIWYDKEGALVYSLKYSQENDLPTRVLHAVKKRYPNRHIDGVIEITNHNNVSYELTLSDDRKWYVVSATSYGDVSLKYALRKRE